MIGQTWYPAEMVTSGCSTGRKFDIWKKMEGGIDESNAEPYETTLQAI